MDDHESLPKHPKHHQMPGWVNFVIGGASGMTSICIVQPMDLIKTRMQLLGPAAKNTSTIAVIKGIAAKEGIGGFYSGISAALLRQATYTTGRLGCFNALMDIYKNAYGVPSFATKFGIGMVSGGVGSFIGTPAEVSLIRMTSDGRLPAEKRRNYKHVFDALARIAREEGLITMWRGAGLTVTRAMIANGAQLGTYSQARDCFLPFLSEGMLLHFCSAMITGPVTVFSMLPVDIVKTRVQNSGEKCASQVGVLMNVIKNEGVLALWSGFLPTYAKTGPNTVLVLMFMEQFRALYFRIYER